MIAASGAAAVTVQLLADVLVQVRVTECDTPSESKTGILVVWIDPFATEAGNVADAGKLRPSSTEVVGLALPDTLLTRIDSRLVRSDGLDAVGVPAKSVRQPCR